MMYTLAYKGMLEFCGKTPEDCKRYFADNKYDINRVALAPPDQGKHMKSPSGCTGWVWMIHVDGIPEDFYRIWEVEPQEYGRE